MNQLISHIEFLLHTHNCVIVPSLGGFVVNTMPARRNGLSVFDSPLCELVFNRELTHNDGLLVESYMRTDGISFENATQKIDDSVRQIKNLLRSEKSVDLGDLGSFTMIGDQRFTYQPKRFVRPEHFGLFNASLKPIIQIQPATPLSEITKKSKKSVMRKVGIGVAAAAVIALIMLIFPIQDNIFRLQTAQILSENGFFGNKTEKTAETTPLVSTPSVSTETVSPKTPTDVENTSNTPTEEVVIPSDATRFYIVTGVYEVRKVADKMIALLQSEGFTTASTIERKNRIDVYASSFSTREEAEQNLKQLKQNFPNHRDAWILKK
ncbi:MAG: Sporulation related domain protein [Bacteroidetes bacterium ADurb.BinA174]|nr:MAG: Sporulation related domain protein [Bacteroidetes bacterium ADurb.BinA174]